MSFYYFEATDDWMELERSEFRHILGYRREVLEAEENFYGDDQAYLRHEYTMGLADYRSMVDQLLQHVGSINEVWNDNRIVPGPESLRYDCEIVTIVPVYVGFRTKELAMIAKLVLDPK